MQRFLLLILLLVGIASGEDNQAKNFTEDMVVGLDIVDQSPNWKVHYQFFAGGADKKMATVNVSIKSNDGVMGPAMFWRIENGKLLISMDGKDMGLQTWTLVRKSADIIEIECKGKVYKYLKAGA